jgi:glyoxylase-like metal-dependent hydrolase (beta-lactamase superfamily II)
MSGSGVPLGDGRSWSGGAVTERAVCVLAPNPGPMTLDGTNTWILCEPGSDLAVVVDPGPDSLEHLDAIVAGVGAARVARILLTHGHPDHSEGARTLAERVHAPVAALDPAHRLGDEGLAGGDVIEVGGLVIAVVSTPGHTADSLSFHLLADGALLTGDTVLGRGSTVVAHPDGRLGDYLDSLHRLRDLAVSTSASWVLPGHGPVLSSPAEAVTAYLAHREARLDQVRACLDRLAISPERAAAVLDTPPGVDWWHSAPHGEPDAADLVVADVYADVPREVWPAARLSVLAQLAYLRDNG